MRVALVHDWLVGMDEEEQCLEGLCALFPSARLFTLFHKPGSVSETISRMDIQTSLLQRFPWIMAYYPYYVPLFPTTIEQFDLSGYDLVISSSQCVAKGVLTQPDTCHICYCHRPMRAIWGGYHREVQHVRNPITRVLLPVIAQYLRIWDVVSAQRVDHFIASSEPVAAQVRKYYRREAVIISPSDDRSIFQARLQQHIQDTVAEFQARRQEEGRNRLHANRRAPILSPTVDPRA
ncbi:MAG: hypothetical protein HY710_08485 [Candidatus Latescibacteria bacterium]|nr:hypothetical protein [Candidatus Latescibacterota bacterium]